MNRQLLFSVHKWSGITIAAFLVLQGVTGVLTVNKEILRSIVQPQTWQVTSDRETGKTLTRIIGTIADNFPGYYIERISYAESEHASPIVRVLHKETGDMKLVSINSGDGSIRFAGSAWNFPLELSFLLHTNLTIGEMGNLVVGLCGIALILMVLTGVYLWWPGRKNILKSLRFRKPAFRIGFLLQLHKVSGVLVSVLLLTTAITGSMLMFEPAIRPLVSFVLPVSPEFSFPPIADATDVNKWINYEKAYQEIQEIYPQGRIGQIRLLGEYNQFFGGVVYDNTHPRPLAYHIVVVDRASGQSHILENASKELAGDSFMHWLLPVHSGHIFGSLRSIITSGNGLILVWLSLSGIILFYLRAKKRKS